MTLPVACGRIPCDSPVASRERGKGKERVTGRLDGRDNVGTSHWGYRRSMSVGGLTQAMPGTGRWICDPCGFIYDPEEGDPDSGIDPGTPFSDIPDDWMCPICGACKSDFRELEPGEDFPEN